MKYNPVSPLLFSGQAKFLETHGAEVWEQLCDYAIDPQPGETYITIRGAAQQIPYLQQFAENIRHRYLRAVLHAVVAEYADNGPDEPQCPVEFQGGKRPTGFRFT